MANLSDAISAFLSQQKNADTTPSADVGGKKMSKSPQLITKATPSSRLPEPAPPNKVALPARRPAEVAVNRIHTVIKKGSR